MQSVLIQCPVATPAAPCHSFAAEPACSRQIDSSGVRNRTALCPLYPTGNYACQVPIAHPTDGNCRFSSGRFRGFRSRAALGSADPSSAPRTSLKLITRCLSPSYWKWWIW